MLDLNHRQGLWLLATIAITGCSEGIVLSASPQVIRLLSRISLPTVGSLRGPQTARKSRSIQTRTTQAKRFSL